MKVRNRGSGCRAKRPWPCPWGLIAIAIVAAWSWGCLADEALTLERALEIALSQSPDIRQAGYDLDYSAENLKAQQAALKSQFRLTVEPFAYSRVTRFDAFYSLYNTEELRSSAAVFRIDQRLKWTDGTISLVDDFSRRVASSEFVQREERTSYDNNLYLSFSQPLFTYNRTKQTLRELELSLENAQLNYDLKKLQLEYQVTQFFYDVFRRRHSIEIAEEEYQNSFENQEIIKNRVEAGISAAEELYQAELNLASARSKRENSKVSYENALDDFKMALGLPLELELDVIADIDKAIVSVDLDKAVSSALEYRMELRQRDISVQNALDAVVRAGANNEFSGSLSLSYGVSGTAEAFSDLYSDPVRNYGVSLEFDIPIWDWGEKNSRIAASEAQLERARLTRTEEEKQIVSELRSSCRSLQNLVTQIEIAEASVRNAQLTYEINMERYRNGDISSKDIGEYQTQLSNQQLEHLSALINYKLALLELKVKSLWDFENNRPVLGQKPGAQQ